MKIKNKKGNAFPHFTNNKINIQKCKKAVEVDTPKAIVAMIIVLIVVVIVIISWAYLVKGGGIDKFISLFPDFFKTNYTAKPPISCPVGFAEVGYIDLRGYININGKKTNLYHDNGKIYVKVPYYQNWGKDYLVGYVDKNVINVNFPENLEYQEIEFRKLFPEEKERRLLIGANIFESTVCLNNKDYNNYVEKDKCALTCQILEGACSSSDISGKIGFKKLNCGNGELCYIDEYKKAIDSLNLHIRKESYFEYQIQSIGKNLYNILDLDKFSANTFEKIRLAIIMNHTVPFCYSFDADNPDQELSLGYVDGQEDYFALRSGIFSYSGEKIFNFIAWNNEKNEKVIARWRFNSTPNNYLNDQLYSIKDDRGWFSSKVGEIYNGAVKLSVKPSKKTEEMYTLEQTFYDDSVEKFFLIKNGKITDIIKFTLKTEGNKYKIYKFDGKGAGLYTYLYLSLINDESGEIIKDNEFAYKLVNAPDKAVFYIIGVKREWVNGFISKGLILTYDYKIIKNNGRVSIYTIDSKKKTWHELYCNKGIVNFRPWYSITIVNIKNSLSETLDKSCMWDYSQ